MDKYCQYENELKDKIELETLVRNEALSTLFLTINNKKKNQPKQNKKAKKQSKPSIQSYSLKKI